MRIASVSGTMGRLAACVEVASILLVSSAALAAPQLVLVNAKVFTADPALPYAQAVAIEDGRILAVGSNEQVRALTGPNTRILDAGGRLVTPGLTEAHVHLGVALPTPPLAMPDLPFPGPTAEQALADGRTGGEDAHRLGHRLYRSADRARPPQLAQGIGCRRARTRRCSSELSGATPASSTARVFAGSAFPKRSPIRSAAGGAATKAGRSRRPGL